MCVCCVYNWCVWLEIVAQIVIHFARNYLGIYQDFCQTFVASFIKMFAKKLFLKIGSLSSKKKIKNFLFLVFKSRF